MKTWHDEHLEKRTLGDIIADMITTFVGSWSFVFLHTAWFFVWIVFKIEEYPYGLLTLIVSLEAIFLSTFVMMNQNRQTQRDRENADADYETNRAAKEEIEALQKSLYRLETEKLDKIIDLITPEDLTTIQ